MQLECLLGLRLWKGQRCVSKQASERRIRSSVRQKGFNSVIQQCVSVALVAVKISLYLIARRS